MSEIKKLKTKQLIPSIVSSDLTIGGDIIGEGALELDCAVEGNIRCLSLVLGKNAIVNGNITAGKVEIFGTVNGNIKAKNIVCGATAKVVGDIIHQTIHIENGAYVDGSCKKFIQIAETED